MFRNPFAPGLAEMVRKAMQPSRPEIVKFANSGKGKGKGSHKRTIHSIHANMGRSKYWPNPRMGKHHIPVDDQGYLIGFGTTHNARKIAQQVRRANRINAAAD